MPDDFQDRRFRGFDGGLGVAQYLPYGLSSGHHLIVWYNAVDQMNFLRAPRIDRFAHQFQLHRDPDTAGIHQSDNAAVGEVHTRLM